MGRDGVKSKNQRSHIRHATLVHALEAITGATGVYSQAIEASRSEGQRFSTGSQEDSSISVKGKEYLSRMTEETLYDARG